MGIIELLVKTDFELCLSCLIYTTSRKTFITCNAIVLGVGISHTALGWKMRRRDFRRIQIRTFVPTSISEPPWRNRLARLAVNQKVGGSNPPGGGFFFTHFSNGWTSLRTLGSMLLQLTLCRIPNSPPSDILFFIK